MNFRREPAAIAALIIAVLTAAATIPNPLISNYHVPLWVALVDAVLAFIVAARVRPIAPAVVTGVISAIAVLAVGYKAPVPHELIAALNAFVVPAVLGLITRAQQTPKATPTTGPGVGGTVA
jgi:hypothetical protein